VKSLIHILHGNRETADFEENASYVIYDNTEYEDYPNHWHMPIEIIVPIENWYVVECAGTVYHLREGDVLLIAPGTLHKIRAPDRGRRMIFLADTAIFSGLSEFNFILMHIAPALCITPENSLGIHAEVKAGVERIFAEHFNKTILKEIIIFANLIQVLAIIGKTLAEKVKSPTDEKSVYKGSFEQFFTLFDYINSHFTENLTLEYMASMAGFSKYYFTRLFKQVAGLSFYKYLNKKRITFAAQLLSDPERSVAEVATHSGFSTLSAFIRMFKINQNCTPTEYRRMFIR